MRRKASPADQQDHPGDHDRDGDVGEDHAALLRLARMAAPEARHHHQRVDRPDSEHHQRVTEEVVAEAPAPILRVVLLDRQRRDVALRRGGRGRRPTRGGPSGRSRQFSNGWSTSRPQKMPSQLFAFRDGRNEPCVQSWKRMKVRSRKPAVGMVSARTSQKETSNSANRGDQSARYGTTEVAMSSRLRPQVGVGVGLEVARPGWALAGGGVGTHAAAGTLDTLPCPSLKTIRVT